MRFNLPTIAKFLALGVFLFSAVYLVSFLVSRGRPKQAPVKTGEKSLNVDINAVQNKFRYAQTENGVNRMILTAEKDTAYTDGRHALEGVKLETFDEAGKPSATLTAGACDYDQQGQKANFKNAVVITTADGLTVKSDRMDYDQAAEVGSTDAPVEFSKQTVSGTCTGARLESKTGRLVMDRAVNVTVGPEKGGQPWTILGGHGEYLKTEQRVILVGGARLKKGGDEHRADRMTGFLDGNNKLQRLEARGNAVLASSEKQARMTARDMDFQFDGQGDVKQVTGTGNVELQNDTTAGENRDVTGDRVETTFEKVGTANEIRTAKVTGNARFKVRAAAPGPRNPQPEDKDLTADTLTVEFQPGGKFTKTAVADGNALLVMMPTVATARADKKTIRAPRMDAAFYDGENRMKTCSATGGTVMETTPVEANSKRLPRKTTSGTATADFDRATGDVNQVVQEGNVAFEEGPRHGTAERSVYSKPRELVQLRGGKRPALWDDVTRVEAKEIDLSTANTGDHFARGDVRVTYYNGESTGTTGTFTKTKSPVFVTAREAQANNGTGRAVYTGDARVWQDDSFIRGDRIEMFQKEKRMTAAGNVSTALYQVERTNTAKRKEVVPIFGTSRNFAYSDLDRRARYSGGVKLVQGGDTLTAENTDIFLAKENSRVTKMTADGKVEIVQPGRRGTGDAAQYTAADERYVLSGNMARVEDAERGTSTGPQLIFTKSNDTVRAEDQKGSRRVRTTYKVQQ